MDVAGSASFDSDVTSTYDSISDLSRTLASLKALLDKGDLDEEKKDRVKRCLHSCEESLIKLSQKGQKLRKYGQPEGVRQKAWAELQRVWYPFRASTLAKLREIVGDVREHSHPDSLEELEYFYIGHDTPTSLFDDHAIASNRQSYNLLFGGIGDARHMFKTISAIGISEENGVEMIARIAVLLLKDVASAIDEQGHVPAGESKLMRCFYYTFLAPIMPLELYDILQSKIGMAIAILEDKSSAPPMMAVAEDSVAAVLRVLKGWRSEVPALFSASLIRKEIVKSSAMREHADNSQQSSAPAEMKKNVAFYYKSGMLIAKDDDQVYPANLQQLYESCAFSSVATSATLLQQVDSTWMPNVTMIDPGASEIEDLTHNPLEFEAVLAEYMDVSRTSSGNRSLSGVVEAFFIATSRAVNRLGSRLTIVAHVEDINLVLEKFQHANDNGASEEQTQLYDRIHLSNIPDYVGGALTTFTYALPCLYPDNASSVSFNCLRNTGIWRNSEHYNNEYTCLDNLDDLQRAFMALPVKTQENSDKDQMVDAMSMLMPDMPAMYGLALQEYQQYARKKPGSSMGLLSRERFDSWLHRLFFNLAITKDRSSQTTSFEIFNPLNLTAFVRLCGLLSKNGYPGHWIDRVLSDICSGSIESKARPPRSSPLSIDEVRTDKTRSEMKQSTKPFVAEMTTLLALWQQTFSFTILHPDIPPRTEIHKYTVKIQPHPCPRTAEKQVLILALIHPQHRPDSRPGRLRRILLSDEDGLRTKSARLVRDNIHLLSVCRIEHAWKDGKPLFQVPFMATFWMRRDLLNELKSSGWIVGIWRTDQWEEASALVPLSDVRDHGAF